MKANSIFKRNLFHKFRSQKGHGSPSHLFCTFIIVILVLAVIALIRSSGSSKNTSASNPLPQLDPPAIVQDSYGHTSQYYSDQMYTAAKSGLVEEAFDYRSKMNNLRAYDIAYWEKIHEAGR